MPKHSDFSNREMQKKALLAWDTYLNKPAVKSKRQISNAFKNKKYSNIIQDFTKNYQILFKYILPLQ